MQIIEHLVQELGVSTKQAEGGAGLLLGLVEQRLSPEEFVRVADTIPAISDVINKAPRLIAAPPGPLREMLSSWFGGLGAKSGLAVGFEKLGCERTQIDKFVDTLIPFFQEKSGEEVATLLRQVLR